MVRYATNGVWKAFGTDSLRLSIRGRAERYKDIILLLRLYVVLDSGYLYILM